jgi:hypothetical protein
MAFYDNWFADSGDDTGIPWLNDFSHGVTQDLGLPDPWESLYGAPAKKQKKALTDAAQQMKDLAAQQRATQMEGLDRAMKLYEPAQKTYDSLYGGELTKAPVGRLR